MKKKILFLAFAALALVACGDHNNEPIDESVIPKGEPTDIGCDINIPQSANYVIDKSLGEAESYLISAGWTKVDAESSPTMYCFICKDTTKIINPIIPVDLVDGPRTTMWVYSREGKVTSIEVKSFFQLDEHPFQKLATWDAWFYNNWKDIEHWSATLHGPDFDQLYSDFNNSDHKKFYDDIDKHGDSLMTFHVDYVHTPSLKIDGSYNMGTILVVLRMF